MNFVSAYFLCEITVLYVISLSYCAEYDNVGDSCNNYGGAPGRCAVVKDCPLALDILRRGKPIGIVLKRCGWEGKDEVVCCPGAAVREPQAPAEASRTPPVWENGDDVTEGNQQSRFIRRKCEQACDDFFTKVKVKPPVNFNIIDGEEVDLGDFPHMAALGFTSEEDDNILWNCGAALISQRYLLTAGHCFGRQKPFIARLGVIDLINTKNSSKAKPQDFNIAEIIIHPRYGNHNSSSKHNDIALIKLDRDIDMTDTVYPACLYTENNDPRGLLVTGWGRIKRTDISLRSLTRLLKGTLSPVDVPECNKIYQKRSLGTKTITGSQICAYSNLTDTCDGDSGGPLQILNKIGTYSLVGVTSYGSGCGGKIPGVYTRVSKYLNWIESIVWPN